MQVLLRGEVEAEVREIDTVEAVVYETQARWETEDQYLILQRYVGRWFGVLLLAAPSSLLSAPTFATGHQHLSSVNMFSAHNKPLPSVLIRS